MLICLAWTIASPTGASALSLKSAGASSRGRLRGGWPSVRGLAPLVLALAVLLGGRASAETLYAATSRGYASPGDFIGRLYVVNPVDGTARLRGPIRVDGTTAVGVTGLAVHPKTGLLYGITAGLLPMRPSLIIIDPKTGDAKIVGALGAAASDINFDSKGSLYAWLSESDQLATVNLQTGHATALGKGAEASAVGGGLTVDRHAKALVASSTAGGRLDSVDLATGAVTHGPLLKGAPYLSAITSLTVSPSGRLMAVNSNLGVPAKASLVSINPTTGVVSEVSALPDDADGLAFSPDVVGFDDAPSPWWWAGIMLALIAVLVLSFWMVWRHRGTV